jgi:hypothetical protein
LGKPDALSVRLPFTTPFAVGVKMTPTVQFAPAARVAPQEFAIRLNGGDTLIVRLLAVALLVLEIVAVWAALG